MSQILYHGSSAEIKFPLTTVGRKELDFGPGFYLTSIKQQAERWAKRVCVIRGLNTPVLSIYSLDDSNFLYSLRRLSFASYDRLWLDFIVASRRGEEPWRKYDIIEGGVANDQVIDTVEDYYAGRLTVEQALGELRFAHPTHQMCISNQDVIDKCLTFLSSETVSL